LVVGLLAALAGAPAFVAAQTAPQPACLNPAAPRVDIFYVNGVTTTLDEARVNAGKLEQEFLGRLGSFPANLQAFCYLFQLNYNPTQGEVTDFLEAGQQRFGLTPEAFWQGLEGVAVFTPLLTELQGPMTDANQIDQATIQRHASRYRQEMLAPTCRRVLVVPHSQGNLYTNAAYDLTFSGPPPNPPVGALKIAGVATPASLVKGNGRYRSSSTDLLINAIRLTLTNTLPANTNWGSNFLNLIAPEYSGGHSFIGYLSFDPSRTDILNDIQANLGELADVNPCPS
jgi:hypothetical protein